MITIEYITYIEIKTQKFEYFVTFVLSNLTYWKANITSQLKVMKVNFNNNAFSSYQKLQELLSMCILLTLVIVGIH
jgi:hypothetical protein